MIYDFFLNKRLILENAPHVPSEHFPESHAIVGIKSAQDNRCNNGNRHVTSEGQPYLFIQKKYNAASAPKGKDGSLALIKALQIMIANAIVTASITTDKKYFPYP